MFRIAFTEDQWMDEGTPYREVRLVLDDAIEYEQADLTHWSEADYEYQWSMELHKIASSHENGALIVSIHNPAVGSRVITWTMWKHGDVVRFQNRILFMLEPSNTFDPANVKNYIGEYSSTTEEDQQISEWAVPIAAIKDFLVKST